jgi:hypothetical protein
VVALPWLPSDADRLLYQAPHLLAEDAGLFAFDKVNVGESVDLTKASYHEEKVFSSNACCDTRLS